MNRKVNQLTNHLRRRYVLAQYWLSRYWFRGTILLVFVYTFLQKQVQINFDFTPENTYTSSLGNYDSRSALSAQSVSQFGVHPESNTLCDTL